MDDAEYFDVEQVRLPILIWRPTKLSMKSLLPGRGELAEVKLHKSMKDY